MLDAIRRVLVPRFNIISSYRHAIKTIQMMGGEEFPSNFQYKDGIFRPDGFTASDK